MQQSVMRINSTSPSSPSRTKTTKGPKNTVDVHIIQGRDLCPRDREFGFVGKKNSSDPYALVCWEGQVKGRTKTVAKSLSPRWDETLHIKVDKERFCSKYSELPPLEIRLYDEDKRDNDGMGIVRIPMSVKASAEPRTEWLSVEPGDAETDWYCKRARGEIEVMIVTPANKEAAEKKKKSLDLLKKIKSVKEAKEKARIEEKLNSEADAKAEVEANRMAEEEGRAAKERTEEIKRKALEEERKRLEELEIRPHTEDNVAVDGVPAQFSTENEASDEAKEDLESSPNRMHVREAMAMQYTNRVTVSLVHEQDPKKRCWSHCDQCIIS